MIRCPRGTRDFLPDEMERRRHYENVLRTVAGTFGFREIATPIFEEASLFVIKSGPNILDEIYAFKDKGDRDLALRPELTAPVVRMFVNGMSNEPRPLKLFYFGQCFRYERPQSGRYREFFQFGAEMIGNANAETDAEAIALAVSMIKALGLRKYKIRIGHIGILRNMLAEANVPQDGMQEILQKLDKKMYDEAGSLLRSAGVCDDSVKRIFETAGTTGGKEVLDKITDDAAAYMKEVMEILEAMNVTDAEIDLGVVRGLDYYTGMVFEAEAPSLGAEKQICGGGSYSLSELFGGEKVFSTGFAIGFDRILLAMEKEGQTFRNKGVDAYVVPVSDDVRLEAVKIASMLRSRGIVTDIDIMRRKMAKAMKHAASAGARYAVIIGKSELEENSVTVRNMETGDQRMIRLDELFGLFL
ncbi:MAG: histidine--tRNA ligase [Methanomassiliicoccaceae archaeon]|nr:histidine--tRNA ligase [Methanomassiliicoccaceae archaeon]